MKTVVLKCFSLVILSEVLLSFVTMRVYDIYYSSLNFLIYAISFKSLIYTAFGPKGLTLMANQNCPLFLIGELS